MSYTIAVTIIWIANLIVLLYFFILNTVYLILSFLAYTHLIKYTRRIKNLDINDMVPYLDSLPITIIAPAYNEEKTVAEMVNSLFNLIYPNYYVIVVNDGSEDNTFYELKKYFQLEQIYRYPMFEIKTKPIRGIYKSKINEKLIVIDKANGGKADALNAALQFCETPYFCAIDSDTLLERESLIRIIQPFLEDDNVIAAGGIIRIVNDCLVEDGVVKKIRLPKKLLGKFQVLEYLRAFLSGRMGWTAIEGTLIISGAFGLFRRQEVVEVGGFANDSVGEDMELVVRIQKIYGEKKKKKIVFIPDPVAWTECPTDLKTLSRQRDRWQRGLIDSLSRHKKIFFNSDYGLLGMFVFPYFYIFEMLGPVIELCGYIIFIVTVLLGLYSKIYIVAFLLLAFIFGMVISLTSLILEELSFRRYASFTDLLQLIIIGILENVGYRQIITFFRVKGVFTALLKIKTWGKMKRTGFKE